MLVKITNLWFKTVVFVCVVGFCLFLRLLEAGHVPDLCCAMVSMTERGISGSGQGRDGEGDLVTWEIQVDPSPSEQKLLQTSW